MRRSDGLYRYGMRFGPLVTFLIHAIRRIWELSVSGDPGMYYRAVKKFILCLPKDVKDELADDVAKADKEIDIAENSQSSFDPRSFPSRVIKSVRVSRVYTTHADHLLDKAMILLDERGYLEKGAVTPLSAETPDIDFSEEPY